MPSNDLDMTKYFSENIIEANLIEKWLDFYTFQLRLDLLDECQHLFDTIDQNEGGKSSNLF
jgi:hypothetical protein